MNEWMNDEKTVFWPTSSQAHSFCLEDYIRNYLATTWVNDGEDSAEEFHNCNQANIIRDFLPTIFPELCLSSSHQNKQVQLKKTGPYSLDHRCREHVVSIAECLTELLAHRRTDTILHNVMFETINLYQDIGRVCWNMSKPWWDCHLNISPLCHWWQGFGSVLPSASNLLIA